MGRPILFMQLKNNLPTPEPECVTVFFARRLDFSLKFPPPANFEGKRMTFTSPHSPRVKRCTQGLYATARRVNQLMLLESLIESKAPCEILIPPPELPPAATATAGGSITPRMTPKVSDLVSASGAGGGAIQQPTPLSAMSAKESNGRSGGAGGALSAFVAPGSSGGGGGSGSGSLIKRKSSSGGLVSPDGLGLSGGGGLLVKSSAGAIAGRFSTVDSQGVVGGAAPRDGGDGINNIRTRSSSSASSSSSFQAGAGGGRLVDGRGGGGADTGELRGERPAARRTIGQAFRPGELECECKYSRRFLLYHRLQAKKALGILATSKLEGFRVDGRSGLYVYRDKEGNVFYMTLSEVRLAEPGSVSAAVGVGRFCF